MTNSRLTQPERVAVARLQAMLELLPTALDRELAACGLTSFEFTLLEALAESTEPWLRLSALAARTNASLPRLSRVVSGLERKGLVERVACASDARATNAVLTAAGRQAFEQSRPLHARAVRSLVLDGLDAADVDQLARLTLSVLGRLDPDGRFPVTAVGANCAADPAQKACAADPAPAEGGSADGCPADPVPADIRAAGPVAGASR